MRNELIDVGGQLLAGGWECMGQAGWWWDGMAGLNKGFVSQPT